MTVHRVARPPVGYYGGKHYALKWLLPLIPYGDQYVEPFGGSAAVLLARRPSKIEHYNDLDDGVVNFYRAVRDHPDELIRAIRLTPYARTEFEHCRDFPDLGDVVEQARRWYVASAQSVLRSGEQWGKCYTESIDKWWHPAERLTTQINATADRLRFVQIDNCDALKLIRRACESPASTVVYCDPPYVKSSLVRPLPYKHQMDDTNHEALADLLHDVDAHVSISGYRCELYDDLYHDWTRIDHEAQARIGQHVENRRATPRTESLWQNRKSPEMLL